MLGMHIENGMLKKSYVKVSHAEPMVHKLADGTVLNFPKECFKENGQFRAGVLKALLLKNYKKLSEKYAVVITKNAKEA